MRQTRVKPMTRPNIAEIHGVERVVQSFLRGAMRTRHLGGPGGDCNGVPAFPAVACSAW